MENINLECEASKRPSLTGYRSPSVFVTGESYRLRVTTWSPGTVCFLVLPAGFGEWKALGSLASLFLCLSLLTHLQGGFLGSSLQWTKNEQIDKICQCGQSLKWPMQIKKKISFIFSYTCMCDCVCMRTRMCRCVGNGVTGSYEMPDSGCRISNSGLCQIDR